MSSLTEFFHAEGMEILPEIGGRAVSTPTAESYVIRHGQAGLHWHTSNGDHYADVLQSNLLLANTADHDRPEDPNAIRGGQMIQPLPNPAQLFGVQHEMLPRASIYPDVDMTLVALIEFHDRAYWCCMCHDLRQVLRGELQTATLAPMTETEFRGVF
ncbi:hypothetical protein [Methanogenium cariaci]|jgi:hypothetical protein